MRHQRILRHRYPPEICLLDGAQSTFKPVKWTEPHTFLASNAQAKLRLELLVRDAIIRRRTGVTTCEQCDDDRQLVARDQKVAQTLGCIPRT